jgi:preprotein translocase subunit SecD
MLPRLQAARIAACVIVILGLCRAMVSASFTGPLPNSNTQAATKLDVRLAEKSPGPGLSEASVSGSGEKVYLHAETVVSNADVVFARVVPGDRPGTFNVGIMFSSDGSAKIEKATQSHLNRPLAVLVNGRVVAAPILRSEIRGSAVITGDFTSAEADAIAAALNGR